jgi:uncharacterized coiled-coil protein SlyX
VQKRIDDLEVKVAFQEHLLAQLDEVLQTMRDEIDDLRRELGDAKSQLAALAPAPENVPPPHY